MPKANASRLIKTIGVIGGGQLGRMFALDAKRMGYNIITLDPQEHSPSGQVSDEQIVAPYDDFEAIDELGARTHVVTYEFENVAIASIERLEKHHRLVMPASRVLRITQDRLFEKQFAADCGIGTAPFAPVNSLDDVQKAASVTGLPMILKTVRGGYDGKGQWSLNNLAAANAVVKTFGTISGARPLFIAEGYVPFVKELSVVAARNAHDDVVCYPVSENTHDNGILEMTIAPARIDEAIAERAREIAKNVGRGLEIVGTYCVELFLTADNKLLLNEIAPRPHNSGHYTIDATQCSQYEQHVRAICDLPLSPPRLLSNAIMVNILGTGTGDTLAGVPQLLSDPNIILHMYGKHHAVARRKMGHFTMLVEGSIDEAAIAKAKKAHTLLHWV